MRFLNRQLLRSIIAAGLAVAGVSQCLASPGKMAFQWKEICFVSDYDVNIQPPNWRIGEAPPSCLLGLTAGTLQLEGDKAEVLIAFDEVQEIRECLIASNPILKFVAHEDLNSRLCSAWIHGLNTSADYISSWIQERQKIASDIKVQTAKIIKNLNFVVAPKLNNLDQQADDATFYTGNIFVFSLENQTTSPEPTLALGEDLHQYVYPDAEAEIAEQIASEMSAESQETKTTSGALLVSTSIASQDACPAEAYTASPTRPPSLEGDLAWDTSLTPALQTSDPHGIGHCRIPENVAEVPTAESPSDSRSASTAGLLGRSLVVDWIDPNWQLHRWANSLPDFTGDAKEYRPGDWTQQTLIRWLDTDYTNESSLHWSKSNEPIIASQVDYVDLLGDTPVAMSAEENTYEPIAALMESELSQDDLVAEEVARNFADAFAAQRSFEGSKLISAMQSETPDEEREELSLDESSRLATKLIALRLKQLGEILIQSAERLDQASNAIDIAGRLGTQR